VRLVCQALEICRLTLRPLTSAAGTSVQLVFNRLAIQKDGDNLVGEITPPSAQYRLGGPAILDVRTEEPVAELRATGDFQPTESLRPFEGPVLVPKMLRP
jgi:hypothetical protein